MLHAESTTTDRLLQAVSMGNQSAVGALMTLHLPYLRRIVELRMAPELKSRVDTSDIVQETQMVIIRRINEFVSKRPSSFRVWLRTRAIEQLADQYRRHVAAEMRSVRREQTFGDASSMAIARTLLSETPSQALQKRELEKQVKDLVDNLREIDREILTLRHAEGLTNNEVAEALRIDPMTAHKRYGRALRRLVERVKAAGLDASLSWEAAK